MTNQINSPSTSDFERLRKKHHLTLVLLHGSRATGKTHHNSDIDIAVCRKPSTNFDLLELISDLSQEYHSDDIDLSDITHADPLLLFAVTHNSKLLAGTDSEYQALQLKAFHRYNDFKPYFEQESEFVRERLADRFAKTD